MMGGKTAEAFMGQRYQAGDGERAYNYHVHNLVSSSLSWSVKKRNNDVPKSPKTRDKRCYVQYLVCLTTFNILALPV